MFGGLALKVLEQWQAIRMWIGQHYLSENSHFDVILDPFSKPIKKRDSFRDVLNLPD